jgi:hypothetical protein
MKVSAAPLALALDRPRTKTIHRLCSRLRFPPPLSSQVSPPDGPSRDLVEHVVAEGQAGVCLECRQGLRPASGQGHLDDGEEFRGVRYELRELGGGAHLKMAELRGIPKRPERAS